VAVQNYMDDLEFLGEFSPKEIRVMRDRLGHDLFRTLRSELDRRFVEVQL
jgi:hypothetical protein